MLTAIVLTLALYNLELNKTEQAKQYWSSMQQMEESQQSQLRSLQSSYAKRGDAVVLEKNLQDLQASLAQRNYVLEQLSLKADGMTSGVAGLMKDLASTSISGLWLTEINLDQGQLSVSGISDKAENVPALYTGICNRL